MCLSSPLAFSLLPNTPAVSRTIPGVLAPRDRSTLSPSAPPPLPAAVAVGNCRDVWSPLISVSLSALSFSPSLSLTVWWSCLHFCQMCFFPPPVFKWQHFELKLHFISLALSNTHLEMCTFKRRGVQHALIRLKGKPRWELIASSESTWIV